MREAADNRFGSVDISIIIICDKIRQPQLDRLLYSMHSSLEKYNTEVLLLQESDVALSEPELPVDVRYFTIPAKKGIPFNRNKGIEYALGKLIVFIDDDCWVQEKWLQGLIEPLIKDEKLMAVTSGTRIPPSNFIGDCVSALGFPGGGSLGFEKVWRVSSEGFTNHLAVGNCALRREVFDSVGMFDEKMRFGAEDAELSVRLEKAGIPIYYAREGFAYHEARTTWRGFVDWQLRRGRANYHFKQKVGSVGGFVKLRLWSAKNIFVANILNWKVLFIFFFLGASFVLQQRGYWIEKKRVEDEASKRRSG